MTPTLYAIIPDNIVLLLQYTGKPTFLKKKKYNSLYCTKSTHSSNIYSRANLFRAFRTLHRQSTVQELYIEKMLFIISLACINPISYVLCLTGNYCYSYFSFIYVIICLLSSL